MNADTWSARQGSPAGGAWHRQSHDIDEQSLLLPCWPQEYLQLERGRLASHVVGRDVEGGVVFRKTTDRRLQKTFATPDGTLAAAVVGPHSDPVTFQGVLARPGDALWLPPGASFDVVCHGRFDVSVVAVDRAEVERWAGDAARVPAGVVPAGAEVQRCAQLIELQLQAPTADAGWQLAGALMGLAARRRPVGAAADQWVPEARRLLTHRVADDGEVPPVDELAARLGVSVRTLQAGFGRRFGLPPARYALHWRLARARAELRRAAADPGAVARVAMRWGFWHLGRFAQAYRAQFGELPSQTLRAAAVAA